MEKCQAGVLGEIVKIKGGKADPSMERIKRCIEIRLEDYQDKLARIPDLIQFYEGELASPRNTQDWRDYAAQRLGHWEKVKSRMMMEMVEMERKIERRRMEILGVWV